ncbi:DUF6776 family protein [Dokdonella sp.]|uniref:DUF6776 family protein n=1 Tax=Dokdonella sp. TaxID=2291710 RepID=UPI003526F8B4
MSTPHFEIRQVNHARSRWVWLFAALIWLGTLTLAVVGTSLFLSKSVQEDSTRINVDSMDVEALKMRIAVLERSEQVARAALVDLQQTLREREEEIAGVRADLAFYGRLVGGAKREGLAVHALRLTPVADSRAWNFSATLTQNFKRGAETTGRLTLSVTGIADGKIETVEWKDLSQESESAGIGYAFKYFQQVNGIIMLPEGFEPNTVRVSVDGGGGRGVQEFSWEDAAKAEESDNVRE